MDGLIRVTGKNFHAFDTETAEVFFSGKVRKARGVGLGLDLGDEYRPSYHDEEVGVWRSTLIDYVSNEELVVGLPSVEDIGGELVDEAITLIAIMKDNSCIIPSRIKIQP